MDDPALAWPAWKFGMKREDLTTKLHAQYNTWTTPIQDTDAFHSDVLEISHRASTKEEFHRLMADRRQQRLNEMNKGLQLASVKIISNPTLIGTDQWDLAIQLFRERSLDALVRYFSSYLPQSELESESQEAGFESDADTIDTRSTHSDISISRSSTTSISTASTDVNSDAHLISFFPEKVASFEPLSIPSPPESHADSDSPAASPTDLESHHEYPINHPTPASRTMSFSDSESGRLPLSRCRRHGSHCPEDATSDEVSDADTPASFDDVESMDEAAVFDEDTLVDPAEVDASQCPTDTRAHFQPCNTDTDCVDSDTPTPRPHAINATSYISAKAISAHLRRSPSPSPRTRLARGEARKSPRMRQRELSPALVGRSPCELLSRIQKPLPDQMRSRPKARRRMEVD